MSDMPIVYVVDDDQAMRDSLHWLIESAGLKVASFATAQDFLNGYENGTEGCLVLDIRMPGMSGLDLQQQLEAYQIHIPIIFITAHGTVPTAVKALQSGAVDFITKPFDHDVLLDRIERSLEQEKKQHVARLWQAEIARRVASLTPREYEVLQEIAIGKLNKVIAADLQISSKTVEAHRAKVMEKMQADSLASLMRMVVSYQESQNKPEFT